MQCTLPNFPTTQIADNRLDCGWHRMHEEKTELVSKPVLVLDIISTLNGADDHLIQLEIDIENILNVEDDIEVFNGFIAKDITGASVNISKLLIG